MAWLVTHMWIALGAVGLLALLLGWSFRGAMLLGRMRRAEIERELLRTELDQANSEIDGLYAAQKKISERSADGSLQDALNDRETRLAQMSTELAQAQSEVASLKTNLDAQAKEHATALATATAASVVAGAGVTAAVTNNTPETVNKQLAADVWRKRHLESRVRFLEAEIGNSDGSSEPVVDPGHVAELEKRLADAQTKAADAEARLIKVENGSNNLSELRAELTAAEAKAADAEAKLVELDSVQARVSELEAQLTESQTELGRVQQTLASTNADALKANVVALQNRVDEAEAALSASQSKLAAAESRVVAAEAEAEAIKAQKDNTNGSIAGTMLAGLAGAGAVGAAASAMADTGDGAGPHDPISDITKWQAQYLRQRVETLENELHQLSMKQGTSLVSASNAIVEESSLEDANEPETSTEQSEELANLRWRNRYLEGRLAYFEEAVERAEPGEAVIGKVPSASVETEELNPEASLIDEGSKPPATLHAADTDKDELPVVAQMPVTPEPTASETVPVSTSAVADAEDASSETLAEEVAEANNAIFSTTAPEPPFVIANVSESDDDTSIAESVELETERPEPTNAEGSIDIADIDAALSGASPAGALSSPALNTEKIVTNPFKEGEPEPQTDIDVENEVASAIDAVAADTDTSDLALERPPALKAPVAGKGDDLTVIGGVGPKIMTLLNSLGIYHFEQIAAWTNENAAWVDDHLSFSGRIERERWVEQAQVLSGDDSTS